MRMTAVQYIRVTVQYIGKCGIVSGAQYCTLHIPVCFAFLPGAALPLLGACVRMHMYNYYDLSTRVLETSQPTLSLPAFCLASPPFLASFPPFFSLSFFPPATGASTQAHTYKPVYQA